MNNKRTCITFPFRVVPQVRSSLLRWLCIWHNAPPEIRLVQQVHDSVVGYVNGSESVWEDLCIRAMTIDCREF